MTNQEKAYSLYKRAEELEAGGNSFLAEELVKVADRYGYLYVKEALKKAKGYSKTAVIEKPDRKSMPHEGLRKRTKEAGLLADKARQAWNWARNNPVASNVGKGAAMTVGGALVAAPLASHYINKATESTFDNIGALAEEYAIPGALAVAGLAAGAYGLSNSAGSREMNRPVLPRRKYAELISGVKTREKLASSFGENSKEVKFCDIALSRILFKG